MPLTQAQIRDLDPNFLRRAENLAKDSQWGSRRTHPTEALRGWWKNAEVTHALVDTTLSVGTSFGVAVASTAIVAAGVAAGAVTFGVAPAIGLVGGVRHRHRPGGGRDPGEAFGVAGRVDDELHRSGRGDPRRRRPP